MQAQQALDAIVRATVASTGDEFFAQLVRELAESLRGCQAFVSELLPGETDLVRAVANYAEGAPAPVFEYALSGTPCQQVLGGVACYFSSGVADLFPDDAPLRTKRIESYLGIPLLAPDGTPLGHIAVMGRGPLSETAQAHDLFHVLASRAAAELRRRRAEQEAAELATALERARRLEALGTLAAGVAHDMRNLLAVARANLDIVLLERQAPPAVQMRVQRAIGEIERGGEFISRVLTVGKPTSVQRAEVELDALIADVAHAVRERVSADVRVVERVQAPRASLDRVLVYDALLNLTRNAAQAIGDRSGAIELFAIPGGPTAAERAIGVPDDVPCVLIGVRDTGAGMDAATVDRLFEPFFTTKAPGEGTGLGLTMVHRTVTAHKGAVRVKSAPGQGTTVSLLLPDLP